MKLVKKTLKTLSDLYASRLQTLLSAEEQIAELLVDMANWADDGELRSTFRSQLERIEKRVNRIRDLVSANADDHESVKSKVVAALVAETEDMVADATETAVRDVALIAASQRVTHDEIAVYGAMRNFAGILGKRQDIETLESILREEKHVDGVLTGIARRVNAEAPKQC